MFRRFTKKHTAVALGAVAALALAVGAYAYFQAEGKGEGSASTGSASAWGVTSSTTGGPMFPGTTSGDETVTVKIKNEGKGNQQLNSFTIEVAKSDGSSWTSSTTAFPSEKACSASDFALGGQSTSGAYTETLSKEDLAPGATYSAEVKLHMLDTGVPQDNCQGLANVPLYISAK